MSRTLDSWSSTIRILLPKTADELTIDLRRLRDCRTGDGRDGQRQVQCVYQLLDFDRLGEIFEEAGGETALDIAGAGVRTQRDDGDMRGRGFPAQNGQRLD